MTIYASYYHASAGQPMNGYEETLNKRSAIRRARELRSNLLERSGGCAIAIVVPTYHGFERDFIDPVMIYCWTEDRDRPFANAERALRGRPLTH